MSQIVIVGGGISGLSAAYYARKRLPESKITVFESDSRWGGKITTDRVAFDNGQFIIEGGPDTFLATKPWGVALCNELGLGDRLHGTNPHKKNTYVLNRNRLLPLPDGLAMMIPTNIEAILKTRLVSWFSKARMGLDFLLPAKSVNGDESLGAFVSRRLGREAYENLIEPLMSGIYAGAGDALSLDLRLKTRVVSISHSDSLREPQGGAWNLTLETGSSLDADSVILATPTFISGNLVASFDPLLASNLQSIPYASTATVSLAYRQSDLLRDLDGYGYVIPRREGRRALACTWTSTKFPHRAPEGYALIRVFVGRAGQDIPWNENDLLALAKEELNLTLGITNKPILSRVFMWDKAMPQYNLGHPEKLKQIDAALEHYPNLALAGSGYRGIGIPDCIRSGELAVERVLKFVHLNVETFQSANL